MAKGKKRRVNTQQAARIGMELYEWRRTEQGSQGCPGSPVGPTACPAKTISARASMQPVAGGAAARF